VRIAVAGAGIAGLAAAIALAQRGFEVDLFERARDLDEIGAGIQLSPNAVAALERLGVAGELPETVEPRAIEIRDAPTGRALARLPLGAAARKRYGAPYLLIHRADLQAGLLDAARREERISVHLHAEVHDIRATDGGAAFDAGGRSHRADLLIAADGVHSGIRTGYFGHAGPEPIGFTAWRATLAAADVPSPIPRDSTGLWLAPGAHLVHYPVRGGAELNIVAIARTAAPAAAPPQERLGSVLRPLIGRVRNWRPWPLLAVDPTRAWARGRVALIGDAAHAMSPSAAQGGAQAIEDAWVLARSLADGADDPTTALLSYESGRRSRVERIAREARRNLIVYDLPRFPAVGRNVLLRALPATLFLSRLDWLFDWKPE
jgi:salicylate hydroxylase